MSRLLRVPVADLAAGERRLERGAARYVARVHRLTRGDHFIAFDPEKVLEADAEIIEASRETVRCRIAPPHRSEAVPRYRLTVLQALGKADKPDRAIRDATVLGARRVVFIDSARVVVRVPSGSTRRAQRWRLIAVEAARQSGRADIPSVEGPVSLERALAEWLQPEGVRLLLDASASMSLGERLDTWKPAQALAVLIGPEGGLDAEERAAAIAAGFELVSLGAFVLRTETALTACLGAIVSRT